MEIYFSGLKRVMGEIIKARRHEYIAQEIAMKYDGGLLIMQHTSLDERL